MAGLQVFDKIISDRGSRYAVSGGPARNRAEVAALLAKLKSAKRFQKATHHSWAAILEESRSRTMTAKAARGR